MQAQVGAKAPAFRGKAVFDGDIKEMSLSDYDGRWLVLFFYTEDYSPLCPTEVVGFDKHFDTFQALGADIVGVSTDSVERHKSWLAKELGEIRYPLLADDDGTISRRYGVYVEGAGKDLRGTFLIDPTGVIKYLSVHFFTVGRSVADVLRTLQALQTEKLVPCDWQPGGSTL